MKTAELLILAKYLKIDTQEASFRNRKEKVTESWKININYSILIRVESYFIQIQRITVISKINGI